MDNLEPGDLDPGWYRDADDPARHRYWDGTRWDLITAEERYSTTQEEAPGRSSTLLQPSLRSPTR